MTARRTEPILQTQLPCPRIALAVAGLLPVQQPQGGAMMGWRTLFLKEILRFWKVGFQTVGAPVLTAILYLLVFGHVLEDRVKVYDTVSYTAFLVPGLVMMSVLQNAFANSSSSLIQSKIMGNLVFLLLTPLSHWHWFFAYVASSVVRGLVVGTGVLLATFWFTDPPFVAVALDPGVRRAGCRADGHAGPDRRPVGRKVRPAGGVPELHHHADDLSQRRVLFDQVAAAVLAGRQPPESVLLHDRRLSLRIFRPERCVALAEPGHRRARRWRWPARWRMHLLRIGYKIRS